MGQAKQRGTLEQRKAEAEKREFELNRARKEHLAKIEEYERASEQMVEAYTVKMLNDYLEKISQEKLNRHNRERAMAVTLAAE